MPLRTSVARGMRTVAPHGRTGAPRKTGEPEQQTYRSWNGYGSPEKRNYSPAILGTQIVELGLCPVHFGSQAGVPANPENGVGQRHL